MTPEEYILQGLAAQFPDRKFSPDNLKLKHKGRFANALVFRYQDGDLDLTIKDFKHCPWPIGTTFGRFCISQEYRAMKRMEGVKGVTPAAYRLASLTVAYHYIKGIPLSELSERRMKLPAEFFTKMETLVATMHQRGLVHLDLRNMGNILAGDDGAPYMIDFQSSMSLRIVPSMLHNLLKATDVSGIYKAWIRCGETPIPPEKEAFYHEFNRIRKFWVLRGYPFRRTWAKFFKKDPQKPSTPSKA
ncbi:MAG: hypothetical protein LBV12_04475 [Puniceicoccales bacterium]|jgi:RIO-like serine/threonine protein kinase|nr:hypothetical protein [Puniceicoccales bacterium]